MSYFYLMGVYFVCNPDSNAIKIGIAKNVRRRLANLQTSSSSVKILLQLIHTKAQTLLVQ